MIAIEAVSRAQKHAESLGFNVMSVDTVLQGQAWWAVSFNDAGPDLGLVVVEDTGEAHIEPEPFGPWFEGLVEVKYPQ